LLRYKPETGRWTYWPPAALANGVAVVDTDETSVLYTSTFESAVMRHHLGKDGDNDGMNIVVVVVVGGWVGGDGGQEGTGWLSRPP